MGKGLIEHIRFIADAHQNHALSEKKAVRLWDGESPYFMHPVWCAATLATETTLPKEIREKGMIALLYHDVPEDTTVVLPDTVPLEIMQLIDGLTFDGFYQEVEEIWKRPPEVRLLKLYDKVSNLLDGSWMPEEILSLYLSFTQQLVDDVRNHFGELNIILMASAILTVKNNQ